jgi:hypothetical protein
MAVKPAADEWLRGLKPKQHRKPEKPTPAEPHLTTVEELFQMQLSRPSEMIEGLITTPGAWVVQGLNKCGKTILCAQVALDFFHGQAWLDEYRMLAKGPVLFVEKDDKGGFASLRDIVNVYPHRNGNMPGFYMVAGPAAQPLTFGPAFFDYLERTIKSNGIKLVVLDSYTALRGSHAPGIDIVKAESYDFGQLDELAQRAGCVILILLHESKGSAHLEWDQRGSGTYAIVHAVSGLIRVDRFRDLPINALERLVQIRGRHVDGAELVVKFNKQRLNYDFVMAGSASSEYVTIQRLKTHLGGQTFAVKDIYQAIGISRATAYRILDRLVFGNVLTRHGSDYKWSE